MKFKKVSAALLAAATALSLALPVGAAESQTAVTSYPVNRNGKTYGSYLDRASVGYAPDLISAIGENDIQGYVRKEDFAPDLRTVGEVEVWQAKVEENNMIPLYDLDENVIGEFALGTRADQDDNDPVIVKRIHDIAGGVPAAASQAPELPYVPNAYPTNAKGETYGSYLDRHEFGYPPELISVIGDNGNSGYVYTDQFRSTQEGDCLDVYDLNGNIVDTFSGIGSAGSKGSP